MKKMEADVVIVGGGMSGISAAVAAAEKDASVIVLEKGHTTGGAAGMGMGLFAVESRYQKEQMVDLSLAEAYETFMDYTHWRVDGRLVRKYFAQSADTIRWLEDMGVEFLGAYKYFSKSLPTWHIVRIPGSNRPAPSCASHMVKAITDRARELGVEFCFGAGVKSIIMDNGAAVGVLTVDQEGNEVRVECDAVIVCTGGFGDNPEMIRQHMGYRWGEDLFSFRIPGLKGEGIRMVWDAGGGKTEVNMEVNYTSPAITPDVIALGEVMKQPNLLVNLDGKRFMNEAKMNNSTFTGNALIRQRKRCAFSILTDEIIDDYRSGGLDVRSVNNRVESLDGLDRMMEQTLSGDAPPPPPPPAGSESAIIPDMGAGSVRSFFAADSLEDLAEQTGIHKESLLKTVDKYNALCQRQDTMFDKPLQYMRPINKGRYYAMQIYPSGYGSLGGIRINDCMQVFNNDGEIIPGLYSAGTDSCSIFGDSYAFILPGNTMGYAVNSGRMAGGNAVDILDGIDPDTL